MSTIDDVMMLADEYAHSETAEAKRAELRAAIEALAQPRKWERLTREEVGVMYRKRSGNGIMAWHAFTDAFQDALIRKNGGE